MPGKFIIAIVLFSLVFIGGAYLLVAGGNKPQGAITVYQSAGKEKPVVEAKETAADLGNLKVSEEKAKIFTIKNIGTKPLQLYNFSTSCGCTAVSIIYQGKASREFSMHAQRDYVSQIAPQTVAQVRVIYRPYVMPVYGVVEREAYISTNDPSNPKLIFKVKALVR